MNASSQSELILKLVALHTRIQKHIAGPLSLHGISLTEYLVLRQLHGAPERKMRRIDLAQQIGLSASGVTRLLNPMQKVGLVSKEEAARDARVSLVSLTSAGEAVFTDAAATFAQVAQSVMKPLNGEEQKSLSRLSGMLL